VNEETAELPTVERAARAVIALMVETGSLGTLVVDVAALGSLEPVSGFGGPTVAAIRETGDKWVSGNDGLLGLELPGAAELNPPFATKLAPVEFGPFVPEVPGLLDGGLMDPARAALAICDSGIDGPVDAMLEPGGADAGLVELLGVADAFMFCD
jgi:hypothetical protein